MADVRALLRQQRSARRIDHPHAVYSDSGKLSCSVCCEPVRLESSWDDHVRSQLHRTSVTKQHTQQANTNANGNALGLSDSTGNGNAKRRRSDAMDDDVEMGGIDGDDERGKKRTRSEAASTKTKPHIQIPEFQISNDSLTAASTTSTTSTASTTSASNGEPRKSSAQLTPPLGRRSSGTPVHGVEMRIPSRPATPIANKDNFMGGSSFGGTNSNGSSGLMSAASTPKIGHLGRSPLIPQGDDSSSKSAPASNAVASAAAALSAATSSSPSASASSLAPPASAKSTLALAQVDEDEWAAFEAEVVNAPAVAAAAATAASAAKPDFSGADVISGAAVAADGTLASMQGEETSRREAEEAQLVDEREEATRALEDEFEEMNELESRVRKLREKREALRSQPSGANGNSNPVAATPVTATSTAAESLQVRRPSATMIDKDNIRQQLAAAQNKQNNNPRKGSAVGKGEPAIAEEREDEDDDEEDEDDEDEDADWDAFRFKA